MNAAVADNAGVLAPDTRLDNLRVGVARACCVYALVAAVVLGALPSDSRLAESVETWVALPVQLAALGMLLGVALSRRGTPGSTAAVAGFVAAFCVLNLVASYVWNVIRAPNPAPVIGYPDVIYLLDYGVLTVAYNLLFVRFGGSWRRTRTWLDAMTMMVALLGAFWVFLSGPLVPPDSHYVSPALMVPYTLTLAVMMTSAALLCVQMPDWRDYPMVTLLVLGGMADAAWEIAWVADWLVGTNCVGNYYNYGDVLCFTLIACAGAATPRRPGRPVRAANVERRADNFLPALVVVLAVALVAASFATTRTPNAWLLVGLVLTTSCLLIVRQRQVRSELSALTHELARRVADDRLTELVRRSSNLIIVSDARGVISFASPASQQIVGLPAAQLYGRRVTELFGAAHVQALGAYLALVVADTADLRDIELQVGGDAGVPRVLKIAGANQLGNPAILGITLTFTDVTEQRGLERQVLDVATQERVRIAADIHDGLGQDLTGIAMLLQSAATAPARDAAEQRRQLAEVITQVNRAIAGARLLAQGLAPVEVVRGSLRSALQRLALDVGKHPDVRVHVDPRFDERVVADAPADHLYRIAHAAVHSAGRHRDCTRIGVHLQIEAAELVLVISDDGRGLEFDRQAEDGIALRMMEYRTRILGGTIAIRRSAAAGAQVEVRVPLRQILSAPEPARG